MLQPLPLGSPLSTRADIYAAVTTALATLEGDLHGGAPSKVMSMLLEIGRPERAEPYVRELLRRGERIMGDGSSRIQNA